MAHHTGTSERTHLTTPDLLLPERSPHLDIPQAAPRLLVKTPGQAHEEESLESEGTTSSYLVISGGTGCNAICAAFARRACYVLPVSDDGGSSSEIIRVLGGPSIGKHFPPSSISVLCCTRKKNCLITTTSTGIPYCTYCNAQVTFARVSYA
jgi:hypothetical protein